MEEILNVVNDTQEITGESQIETTEINSDVSNKADTDIKKDGAVDSDLTTQKPGQDKVTNDNFAAARREAESQAKTMKDRQDNFAKQYGYNTFEELEEAQKVQTYVNKGVDPAIAEMKVRQEKLEQQLALQGHESRIAKEMTKMQNKKHFADLKPEIEGMLAHDPSLDVEACYDYVRGKRADELEEKEAKAAAQRQLNNINSKSHIKPDGGGIDLDNIKIDEEEFEIAKSLNKRLTRDEWVKFKKSQRS
jgi:hypothetical protein